ncbi:hypothetical protein BDV34DRAFT_157196 [Aspergillus parasiticus]|uniref:Uncharacterized protein n=1 Tax=Aspergillus parasiticus TaxID=5067 RepID=A0A5N6DBB5_ASPPA|nr:hypothetical protein BDV34DRAFT_157196 [Aspergillus parasiticus]
MEEQMHSHPLVRQSVPDKSDIPLSQPFFLSGRVSFQRTITFCISLVGNSPEILAFLVYFILIFFFPYFIFFSV